MLLQLKDPLELFVKRWEIIPGYGFLSHCDMTYADDSNLKTNSFLPSFLPLKKVVVHSVYEMRYLDYKNLYILNMFYTCDESGSLDWIL